MNYGFIESLVALTDYVLGNNTMPWVQFRPDGNWEDHLPKYENQTTKLGHETSGCTVWGLQNQVETMWKYRYKEEPNYSERYTYNLVPVDPGKGVDPQRTYETVRKHGLIDERRLPMTDSIDEYTDKSKITGSLLAQGQNWLRLTTFQHEWLWQGEPPKNRMDILKEALKTCPIGVSVHAWIMENGVYISNGNKNNHWCLLYKIDDEGHPWVFDSYDHSTKRLSKDHNIRRAKRVWIQRKTRREMKKDLKTLSGVVEYLTKLLMKKDILHYANANINTDVTPFDEYKDEVSCAWSLTALEQMVDPTFKRIPGTWNLWDYYEHNPKFARVTVPTPGTRIICATLPNKPFPGHCGVFMEDMTIASNDSRTGKFIKNFTLDTWIDRYVTKGGYTVHMYDRVD